MGEPSLRHSERPQILFEHHDLLSDRCRGDLRGIRDSLLRAAEEGNGMRRMPTRAPQSKTRLLGEILRLHGRGEAGKVAELSVGVE